MLPRPIELMRKRSLFISVVLLLSIAVPGTTVGIPIARYLCPDMEMNRPVCLMLSLPSSHTGTALSNVTPSCCVKQIQVEGKKMLLLVPAPTGSSNTLIPIALVSPTNLHRTARTERYFSPDAPPGSSPPLDRQNDALLI